MSVTCHVLLVLWLARAALHALVLATGVDIYLANGTFQLLNPLRRILDGQRISADFEVFHGALLPVAHLALMPQGFSLTHFQYAHHLITPLALLLGMYAVALAGTRSPSRAAVFTIAAIAGIRLLNLGTVIEAGNSLLGLRSIPVLFAAAAVLAARTAYPLISRFFLGILAAASFFFSWEQGLTLLAALLLSELLSPRHGAAELAVRVARRLLALAGGAVSGGIVIGVFITGSWHGLMSLLRFAVVDIPTDQGWFFAAPPSPVLTTWGQLLNFQLAVALAFAVALGAALVRDARRARLLDDIDRQAVLLLVIHGLLGLATLTAIWIPDFPCSPLIRNEVAAALLIVARYSWRRPGAVRQAAASNAPAWTRWSLGVSAFLVPFALGYLPAFVSPAWARKLLAESAPAAPSPTIDWVRYRQSLDSITVALRNQQHVAMWSLYAGYYELRSGTFQPSGTDYIIHAVGKSRREHYLKQFDRISPGLVQTLRPSYFGYESWLQLAWWPIYERILADYELAVRTPYSNIWRRRQPVARGALPRTRVSSLVRGDTLEWTSTAPHELFLLEARDLCHSPLQPFPILKLLPHCFLIVQGALNTDTASVQPYGRFQLPVVSRQAGTMHVWPVTAPHVPGAYHRLLEPGVEILEAPVADVELLFGILPAQGSSTRVAQHPPRRTLMRDSAPREHQ